MTLFHSRPWRWLAAVSAVVLILGLVALPALAATPRGLDLAGREKNGRGHGRAHGGPPSFSDVDAGHWAWSDIEAMAAKGVINGYDSKHFGPKKHVTRLEVVVLVTRLLGYEDEAMALKPEEVSAALREAFTDYRAIPDWPGARECLAYAAQKGYLWPLLQGGDGPTFRPKSPAKRAEVVTALLEAAGFGSRAKEKSLADIPFKDASAVPSWARGYIALAVELGLVRGEKGTLRPNQPVTRAEIAALLHRLDDLIDTELDRGTVVGRLVSVNVSTDPTHPSTITIVTSERSGSWPGSDSGHEETYELAAGVVVMIDDKQATLADLRPGQLIALYLNEDGKVLLVDAETATEAQELTGVLVLKTLDADGRLTGITLWHDGKAEAYDVAPDAKITRDGQDVPLSELVAGLTVTVQVKDDVVVSIAIGAGEATTEVTGLLVDRTLDADGRLTGITLWHDGKAEAYDVAPDAKITRDGQDVPLSELVAGLTVTVQVKDDVVVSIAIHESGSGEVAVVTGTVTRVEVGTGTGSDVVSRVSIIPDGTGAGGERTYDMAPTAGVLLNGQAAALGDVRPGDTAQLHLNSLNQVVLLEAAYQTTQATGIVVGVVTDASGKLITLTLRVSDQITTYLVDPDAKVLYEDHEVPGTQVGIGDSVTVQVARGAVIGVTIVQKAG